MKRPSMLHRPAATVPAADDRLVHCAVLHHFQAKNSQQYFFSCTAAAQAHDNHRRREILHDESMYQNNHPAPNSTTVYFFFPPLSFAADPPLTLAVPRNSFLRFLRCFPITTYQYAIPIQRPTTPVYDSLCCLLAFSIFEATPILTSL